MRKKSSQKFINKFSRKNGEDILATINKVE